MSKKSKGTKRSKGRSTHPRGRARSPAVVPGDLRAIAALAKRMQDGDSEAAAALHSMGRDAAHTLLAIAAKRSDAELETFARRLIPIRPDAPTNMYELRTQAVTELVDKARQSAPDADSATIEVDGGAVALFDPVRVRKDLARSGRPRHDPARIADGDIAWFGLPTREKVAVSIRGTSPDVTATPSLRQRLRVESGLVFVGPPEASDGPRLGTVVLDPFTTRLHENLHRGGIVALGRGTYSVVSQFHEAERRVDVHVVAENAGAEAGAPAPRGGLRAMDDRHRRS